MLVPVGKETVKRMKFKVFQCKFGLKQSQFLSSERVTLRKLYTDRVFHIVRAFLVVYMCMLTDDRIGDLFSTSFAKVAYISLCKIVRGSCSWSLTSFKRI